MHVACAGAVAYFLLMPVFQQEHNSQISRMDQRIVEIEAAHEVQLQERADEIDSLHQDIESLNAQMGEQAQQTDLQQRILEIHTAYSQFRNGLYQQAFHTIDTINMDGFPHDIIERAEVIREGVYPELAIQYYRVGHAAFNDNDPQLALTRLERAFRFMNETATEYNELLFMLGSLYYNAGRLELAEERLQALRDRAPNFRPQAATTMLNSIAAQNE